MRAGYVTSKWISRTEVDDLFKQLGHPLEDITCVEIYSNRIVAHVYQRTTDGRHILDHLGPTTKAVHHYIRDDTAKG